MQPHPPQVAVIGGGPAGLMAAEVLSADGAAVTVYERMPSVGRKLLMAGKGGLNITHTEPREAFYERYGDKRAVLEPTKVGCPNPSDHARTASGGNAAMASRKRGSAAP